METVNSYVCTGWLFLISMDSLLRSFWNQVDFKDVNTHFSSLLKLLAGVSFFLYNDPD